MPTYRISVVNQSFESHNEHELPTLEVAQAEAIKGALQIGVAEVSVAKPFFAAEIKVGRDGEQIARYVVSVGVSALR
jgi:hypothetical protein